MVLLESSPELPKKDAIDEAIEKGDILRPAPEEKEQPLTPAEPLLRASYEEPEKPITPAEPLFFPRPPTQASYDWIDILSATGYIVFDGFNAIDSGGNNYRIIDSGHSSSLMGLDASGNTINNTVITGNSGQSTDIDFDTSILQLPRTIEGDVIVRISVAANSSTQVDGMVITAKLRKVSGGETEIANTISDTFNISSSSEETRTLIITVPRTHFKKGDLIRLTILISTTDNDLYRIGHDPNDRVSSNLSANNTRFSVAIPFKLDFM